MNFKELYDNNRATIETLLMSLWCGEPRNEQQKKYAEQMRDVVKDLFAPTAAVPVVQCMNLYKSVHSVTPEVAKSLVGDLWTAPYPPYEHQYQCWNALLNKKTADGKPMSIVVTTGTGSGKTECFMMPLAQDLIHCGQTNQIQALFLYPLNALMEDQKERLEKLLEGTNLTYAVYNGDLPEKEPDPDDKSDQAIELRKRIAQVRGAYKAADGTVKYKFQRALYTREQVRATPPNILLTNPTMLEYILLRQADASLINPIQKSLRWVAIDETHSYTGAGAAELAMLLRRVLLAFNVRAEDLRFATSSATFGNAGTPEGAEKEKAELQAFIGGITGLPTNQIEVVGGVRIGEEAISENPDKELWQKICRSDYLSLESLFPDGTISDKLGLLEAMCTREDALAKDPAAKMKVKVHYFYRVPNNGLYVRLTEQEDGCLKIYSQNELGAPEDKAPLLELARCKHCGGFVAVASYDPETGEYEPRVAEESDMFDIEEDGDAAAHALRPIILGVRKDDVEMGDGNIMLRADENKLENVVPGEPGDGAWHIIGNTNYRCPYCNVKVSNQKGDPAENADEIENERYAKLQRFRISAEVVSRYLAPTILDQLEKGGTGGEDVVLHDGQQYISFVDSRQAAAIATLKQNLEQEQRWVYSTIFHELCKQKSDEAEIRHEIENLRKLRDETADEDEEEKLSDQIKILRGKLSGSMRWKDVFELLFNDVYCDVFCGLFVKRSSNSEETNAGGEITTLMKTKYVHSVMAMYLARRPKSAAAPETMGLFHVTYPQLKKVKLPESVESFNGLIARDANKISEQDWRDLLQVFLDYTVRSNQSVFFKESEELKLDIFSLNRFATEKPRRRPVKKPHLDPDGLGTLPRVAVYLGSLLADSLDMADIRKAVSDNLDAVNSVLDGLWTALTVDTKLIEWGCALSRKGAPVFEKDRYDGQGDEPYRMNLVNLSFRLYEKVRLCDVNGGEKVKCPRPVETAFKDFSLYPTHSGVEKLSGEAEEWGVFPYYRGSPLTGDAEALKLWYQSSRKLLCEGGLWGDGGLYTARLNDIHLMPNLFIQAEHTAQVDKEVARTLQAKFKSHSINILACSTTMEMGVDLGNLEVVMLSSVPPMPANYKQRAGRSGRNNKVRSVCLTLCGSDAVGLRTLYSPIERIISRPVAVPKVDLKSQQVVKRHVNAYLVRTLGVFGDSGAGGNLSQKVVDFFTPFVIQREGGQRGRYLVIDPATGHQQHPDATMGDDTGTRYRLFLDKCSDPAEMEKVKDGLISLLRGTCYAGEENVSVVVQESKETLERCYQELCEKVEDIKWAYNDKQAATNPRFRAKLEIQYLEVLGERLLTYWATHRFTPNANMPVNVLALDLNSSRDLFSSRFSSNPSYSLREAISQYVPGNCVVVDGIVYKVRGVEFHNMYNPVNTFKVIRRNNECVKIDEPVAAAIPWPINEKVDLTLVSPTGFIPDFNEDYTRIIDDNAYTHVSAQLIGATDWTGDDADAMVSIRTNRDDAGDAKILYYNEGQGFGYCFCSKCGRMVLENAPAQDGGGAASLPQDMNNKRPKDHEAPNYHLAMNGKTFRQKCAGSDPSNGVYRNVIIGDLIQTDYSELRLRPERGEKWIGTRNGYEKLLFTLAIAFSQSLVDVLGKERGSVDFAITPTGRICIFDVNPGGAGYANQLKDQAILSAVLDASVKMLNEAKEKDAADILLDKFTVRHIKRIDVDSALAWLTAVVDPSH